MASGGLHTFSSALNLVFHLPQKTVRNPPTQLDNTPAAPSISPDAFSADHPPYRSCPHPLVRARSAIRFPTTRV